MKNIQKLFVMTATLSATLCITTRDLPAITSIDNIPQYPGSQTLCNEHLAANGAHILWKSFGTRDVLPVVAAYFEKELGVKAAVGEHEAKKIAHPANADLIVTIYPKKFVDSFPTCAQKPDPSAETIVLVSQAIHEQRAP
ncbi:MAG: hypothetical protein K8R69_08200 [Deltaproteobacteria bacterium]|nr:hypothetical protein [Deltaproteobacteria bacterium]